MDNAMEFSTDGITISNRILHTPSDFAKKNLLYIQEVGRLKSLKPHSSSRKNIESYLLLLVTAGKGTVLFNGIEYKVKERDIVFIDCRQPYEHISDEKNAWELAWVHFNGGVAAFYDLFCKQNNGIVYSAPNIQGYTNAINELMNLQQNKDMVAELNTSLVLYQLLTHLLTDVMSKASTRVDYICKIREIINERFKEEKLLENICAEYNLDRDEIADKYMKKYGIDINAHILNRRFTCAKELLRFTVKPINQVIVESGIRDEKQFKQLFYENEGMTAEEYREKWSQWNRG